MSQDLGWLDTNIFVHALHRGDLYFERCRTILNGLESGEVTGWIDPLVVHELTYVLKRLPSFKSRGDVEAYIRAFLLSEAVYASDKPLIFEALARWAMSDTLSFTDSWLITLSRRRNMPICSVNQRDFDTVPNSFPL